MPSEPVETNKRLLEPSDRVAEVLFGLIMVLTFTGSLSAAEADSAEVRTMLIGALGCNFAWGVIDAILYLMGCLAEQGRALRLLRAFQGAEKAGDAHLAIAAALPPRVAAALGSEDFELLRRKLVRLPPAPSRPHLGKDEWLAAFGVFLWVVVTTFPVAIPFIFMHDVALALRASNAIALVMLFVTGYAFGRISHYHPWVTGLAMVALGVVLVAMTIALGG
jgi:VIT1/CCC1 family predicted Fe2+/Mn2+ transporter